MTLTNLKSFVSIIHSFVGTIDVLKDVGGMWQSCLIAVKLVEVILLKNFTFSFMIWHAGIMAALLRVSDTIFIMSSNWESLSINWINYIRQNYKIEWTRRLVWDELLDEDLQWDEERLVLDWHLQVNSASYLHRIIVVHLMNFIHFYILNISGGTKHRKSVNKLPFQVVTIKSIKKCCFKICKKLAPRWNVLTQLHLHLQQDHEMMRIILQFYLSLLCRNLHGQ